MRLILQISTILLLVAWSANEALATHVRAGEITARRLSSTSLTYEIKFTGYYDMENGRPAAENNEFVDFWITGENAPVRSFRTGGLQGMIDIGNNTSRNEYVINYTFPAPGNYNISLQIDNRNEGIINLGGAQTQLINFFIKTNIAINASLGLNRTPVMLNAPVEIANVGQRYIHNPAAFDADGDSLAYEIVVPQDSRNGGQAGRDIPYVDPNLAFAPPNQPLGETENGTTPSTFSIDPVTGDLIWNAPYQVGFYNVAFVIKEYRNGQLIGTVTRDMQIIVVDIPNERPELAQIPDICVVAGERIQQQITARDPNANQITLASYGGVYEEDLINPELAEFTQAPNSPLGQATGNFTWQTSCTHIREEPYRIAFTAKDSPGPDFPNPSLFRGQTDITTLSIRVVAPPPANLEAEAVQQGSNYAFRLTWDKYACQTEGAQIVIYRKEGCSNIVVDECQTGLPLGSGYEVVDRVDVNEITYLDDNEGEGFPSEDGYSYLITTRFPRIGTTPNDPGRFIGGSESVISNESCEGRPSTSPVITNVTVDSTDEANGKITVRWSRPVDGAIGSGPFQYRLYRATGFDGADFELITTINTTHSQGALDTLFTDTGLNTTEVTYRYRIEYYSTQNGQLARASESDPASSVRLEQAVANAGTIGLRWAANVPWDNSNQTHRIYREVSPEVFNQIAEVNVQNPNTFIYEDDGEDRFTADGDESVSIDSTQTYCYRVETVGTYNMTGLPPLLNNYSQKLCVESAVNNLPCPPSLSMDALDCDNINADSLCSQTSFTNNLTWSYPASEECNVDNIVGYKIYYSRYLGDELAQVGTVNAPPTPPDTTFAHTNGLTSYAGCYFVTAVNQVGLESEPSNIVCKDNCPVFLLPNVFTPNGDGTNDVFEPFSCSAFVERIDFRVYNRWGAKVWETTDIGINWNGQNSGGRNLPAGQYYYECRVYFESVNRSSEPKILKGWIQLLR